MPASSAFRHPTTAPTALYQQVKEFIVRKIVDGTLKPGDRIPSEHELVAEFGIARMTVNRALRELVERGSIVRVTGVGSFVAPEKPQSALLQIANIADEIRQRGHEYRCEVLSKARETASKEIADALDLRPGEPVYHTLCVHYDDNVPIQREDRYVNPRMAPNYLKQNFSRHPPSEYLLRNVRFDQMEHVVDAVLPTPKQAEQLQMPRTEPCLLLTRRTWYQGIPVTFVRCLHPGPRYRLGSRFARPSASP